MTEQKTININADQKAAHEEPLVQFEIQQLRNEHKMDTSEDHADGEVYSKSDLYSSEIKTEMAISALWY